MSTQTEAPPLPEPDIWISEAEWRSATPCCISNKHRTRLLESDGEKAVETYSPLVLLDEVKARDAQWLEIVRGLVQEIEGLKERVKSLEAELDAIFGE